MNPQSSDRWQDCSPGTFSKLAQAHTKQTKRSISPFATGIIVGAAACLLFTTFSIMNSQPPVAAISCAAVLPQLSAYQAGTLDANLDNEIRTHLLACSKCRKVFGSLSSQVRMTDSLLAQSTMATKPTGS